MEKSKLVKSFLIFSGVIAFGIGGGLLFVPIAFEATNGINIAGDVNLLSEMRAAGGMLLAGGFIIFLGAFISKITFTSIMLSALIYLSYGVSRVVGAIIDGIPNESLVAATVIEIIVGLISIYMIFKIKNNKLVQA